MNVMQETQKIAAVVLFKDLHAKKWTYIGNFYVVRIGFIKSVRIFYTRLYRVGGKKSPCFRIVFFTLHIIGRIH